MSQAEPLIERVIDFVAVKTHQSYDSITEGSSFYDMGIDGEDATELLEDFAESFEVDMSGFEPSAYYGPEAASILFIGKRPRKSLTVGLLVQAAQNRKWSDT